MDNYARQVETKGLTIPYYDYLLTRSTLTPNSGKLQYVRTVGGANRICTRIIIANTIQSGNADLSNIDNIYNSQYKTPASNDPLQIQIKYNDRNLFPRPLENQALLF